MEMFCPCKVPLIITKRPNLCFTQFETLSGKFFFTRIATPLHLDVNDEKNT
jgi:hypothetical protein